MADIINYQSVTIASLMANLERYKYNPSGMQRVILDCLDEVTAGEVDIVDPTSPFVFLLEASVVNTALANNESVVNLRQQYPSLSQTEEDLYLHLSDKDFINRFAVPSETEFTLVIQVNDLLNKMVYDDVQKCYMATIARDSEFKIDDITFTLQYPINIRKFDNGSVQISYDATIESPLQTLTSNIVDYSIRKDQSKVDWVFFKLPVSQFVINSAYYPIQLSSIFSYDVPYVDNYYYARVFYKNNESNNKWVEILTTHTDQVFDPFKPTAVIKVFTGQINLFIPTIYLTNGLISGDVRVDIYTTKGELTINLANYKLGSFQTNLKAIDEPRDIDEYTNAMTNLSFYSYNDQIVSGGTNGIDFATLRERVIFNSLGDRQLPITNVQLEAYVNNKGFDLVKNVDVITNRIFLATQKLPKPIDAKLITSANIGISTIIVNTDHLRSLAGVIDNGSRLTILSDNLYLSDNGKVSLLTYNQIDAIKQVSKNTMVDNINNKQYLYTPFHYVLDGSQSEFEMRAYNLDYPTVSGLSFISQNQSIQLPVNTGGYTLEKVKEGYKLTVITKSGNFYKELGDNLVDVQLAYYPTGETSLAYINGILEGKTEGKERIYSFLIVTNYDLNSNDELCITNGKMFTNELFDTWTTLIGNFHILYSTTSITDGYIPDSSDSLLGKFLLPAKSVGVTHETLMLTFGSPLKNLWVRSRTFATGLDYSIYPADIPLMYDKDIYTVDPVTNSMFLIDEITGDLTYTILHNLGDPVLDLDGNPVYKHHRGDVVLDLHGRPTINSQLNSDKELDLLFVDGKYFFTDDVSFVNYKHELVSILDTWITNDLISIQNILLEQTKIFFYPKTTLGLVKVFPDSVTEDSISSEQSITVDLYVKNDVYSNNEMRQVLIDNTIKLLDNYISNTVVNLTEITLALKVLYGSSVTSLSLSNLGGMKNYTVITLATEHNRLCLKKKLVVQQDGTIIIKEDITVNFHNIEKPLS